MMATDVTHCIRVFPRRTKKLRCYVMIGFGGETLAEAETRLDRVYGLGFLPFAQLYRGHQAAIYPAPWKALARKWSRPAAYRSPSPAPPETAVCDRASPGAAVGSGSAGPGGSDEG